MNSNQVSVSDVKIFRYLNEDCIRLRPGSTDINHGNLRWHFLLTLDNATYSHWHQVVAELVDVRLKDKEENLHQLRIIDDDNEPTWREIVIPNNYETLQNVINVLKRHMSVKTLLPSREYLLDIGIAEN